MTALGAMRLPWWVRAAEKLRLASLLRSLRYDTRQLPASERASDDDGLRMLALARLDEGTYSSCEVCGDPIDDELLARSPGRRRCDVHEPA